MAFISKWAGGIGVHLSSIRAKGSIIRGTNGMSDGIIPLCILLNKLGKYINQGGKRNGSIATYLEPWHADIFEFCELRKNTKDEDSKARDLFLALWIPDLFIKRFLENGKWSLMCPDECPGLTTSHGEEFERLYIKYEKEGRYKRQVKAIDLFYHIMECQIETGMPYMLYKDHANHKSNQKNLGTIRSSNLCVAGDTYVLTKKGQLKIKDIVNQKVDVWNGSEWSNVTIKQTGTDQELVRVSLSNGVHIDCTPEHKFYKMKTNKTIEVQAKDLQFNDTLINWKLPTINNKYNKLLEKYVDETGTISHTNKEHILNIRLSLQTYGIESSIISEANKYHLVIKSNNDKHNVQVQGITKLEGKHDTYCFTEPKRHMGVFNGILTGQCAEIIEYSDGNEYAVCNLTSICLPSFIETNKDTGEKTYNYKKLGEVTKVNVRNLNKIIDRNYYPTPETKYSNMRNRPIGIGVQGLADVYNIFGHAFGSDEARALNKKIHETIYYHALEESCKLAQEYGKVETFHGSPFSQGLVQWHLWGLTEADLLMKYDWKTLIENIKKFGTRNSLLTALMPTASTSQIMGNYEAFEPYQSNIFVRSTLAGEFIVLNENLVRKLLELGLWSDTMRKRILVNNGSIQNIKDIPEHIREVFKTAFEIKQKDIITQAAERGPFVDQSQSMNLFMEKVNYDVLKSCHITSWKMGLKTGMYYLRSRPAVDPLSFGIDAEEYETLKNMNNKTTKKPRKAASKKTAKSKTKLTLDDIKFDPEPSGNTRNVNIISCIGCSS